MPHSTGRQTRAMARTSDIKPEAGIPNRRSPRSTPKAVSAGKTTTCLKILPGRGTENASTLHLDPSGGDIERQPEVFPHLVPSSGQAVQLEPGVTGEAAAPAQQAPCTADGITTLGSALPVSPDQDRQSLGCVRATAGPLTAHCTQDGESCCSNHASDLSCGLQQPPAGKATPLQFWLPRVKSGCR